MITSEVRDALLTFTAENKPFISLDIYCTLGRHFNDVRNPIYEQVREAYTQGLLPNYLCKWVKLSMEGGGQARVWKYYVPVASVQTHILAPRGGSFLLTKKQLGPISLLGLELTCHIELGKITYRAHTGDESPADRAPTNRLIIPRSSLRTAGLHLHSKLCAKVYPARIEISKPEEP